MENVETGASRTILKPFSGAPANFVAARGFLRLCNVAKPMLSNLLLLAERRIAELHLVLTDNSASTRRKPAAQRRGDTLARHRRSQIMRKIIDTDFCDCCGDGTTTGSEGADASQSAPKARAASTAD